MQEPMSSESQLFVVELGAEWPSALLGSSSGARRVLTQEESESPAAFAVRVGEQVTGLLARGIAFGSALLCCSERLDPHAQGARVELARAAASALARGHGGDLLLFAADRNEGRSRPVLSALVGELAKEWQSAAVAARLRFSGDEIDTGEAKSRTGSRRGRAPGPGKDGTRRVA